MRLFAIRLSLILSLASLLAGCGDTEGTPENNRAAAELVLQKGGSVHVKGVSYPIEKASKLPAGDLVLKAVNLAEKPFNDEELKALAELKALERLNLYGTGVTNEGLDSLLPLGSLMELELSYTLVDDEGLQKLKDLKKLQKLRLYGTQITDDGIKSFQLRRSDVKIFR